MTESLRVDGETLRSSAAGLVGAGGQVAAVAPLDLDGCGSPAVAAEAARFNARSRRVTALIALQLEAIGQDAQQADDSWGAADDVLATHASVGQR